MSSKLVLEHELTELRDNLDAATDIIGEICEPGDDLVWALGVITRATSFVVESLDRLKDGERQ